ncbi:MAG TPA: hypothetical protein VNM68_01705 [Candidatus Polarisedimenticolia bacterium]|nr:hypothetical protein [Candidatus Polarisedimenticolia bacterium]
MAGKSYSMLWRLVALCTAGLSGLAAPATGADLEPATRAAFDRYVQRTEAQMNSELARHEPFLWIERLPPDRRVEADRQVRAGQIVVQRLGTWDENSSGDRVKPVSVPGGMIHHWIGTVFIPGASLAQTLAFEEDYDRHANYFRPDVMRSKILQHNGNDFVIELRLYKKKVITTVLDTEHQVHYTLVDSTRARSRSRSTRIQEVDDAGKPDERLEPVGHDHGFLWRMNTYWRFEQGNGGTYVECESVSLTRDIPAGLGWLIGPYVTSVPRESLIFTLAATRAAVLQRISLRAAE